jgi:hypothetical protein
MSVLVTAASALAVPPSGNWYRNLDGGLSLSDAGQRLAVGPDGSVSVTGVASAASGLQDMLTVKYDSAGNLVWSHRFIGPPDRAEGPQDIIIDDHGNTYVVGQVYNGNRVQGGTDWDYVTIKYAPDGEVLWTRLYDGEYHWADTPMAIVAAPGGGVYIGGFSMKEPDSLDRFRTHFHVMKYDEDGNQQWEVLFDHPVHGGAGCNDLAIDSAGNIVAIGAIARPNATGQIGSDLITMKISPGGDVLWTRYWNTTDFVHETDEGYQVRIDAQDNPHVFGRTFTSAGNRNQDEVIVKYTPAGDEVYVYITDFARPDGMIDATFDPQGNSYFVGGWSNALDHDGVMVSLSPSGQERWRRIFDGTGTYDRQEAHFAQFGPDGRLYVGLDWQYADVAGFDVTIAVLSSSGTPLEQWRFDTGSNSDTFQSIGGWGMDSQGSIFAAGFSWFTPTLGDYLVMKLPTVELPACAADFTGDGLAQVPDIFAFLSLWFASDAAADFDGNGTIAVPDIFAFLGAWFVGC